MSAIILKHEMPIDAALAKSLIEKYGAAHMMVNGGLPEPVYAEDIDPTDVFKVCINYGNEVRLVLESDSDVRADPAGVARARRPRRVKLQLRPYQEQGVADIRSQFAAGKKSVLYVLPTGGGKTVTYSHIAAQAGLRGNRGRAGRPARKPRPHPRAPQVEITLERLFGQCEERVEDGVLLPAEWHAVAEL